MDEKHFQTNRLVGRKSGFALLFSILAASVLLSVSIAIWSISFRELVLSSFGRESQSAFYIADSAIECALYWDLSFARTGVYTFATSSASEGAASSVTCGGQTVPIVAGATDSSSADSTFQIDLGDGRATVIVSKNDPSGTGFSLTEIDAHGQNSVNASDVTLVERGLRTKY
jgi:hypothetical protein